MANDPGWYADPWRPGRRRWWDGSQWTDHTYDPDVPAAFDAGAAPGSPALPPPAAPAPPSWQQWQPVAAWQPFDPAALARVEIAAERRMAVWAKRAFVTFALTSIVSGVVSAFTFHDYADYIRQVSDSGTTSAHPPAAQLWTQPLGILGIVAVVLVMVWSHRAMVVARNLRYPAQRSIGWSVAGWIVPLINFWFPYATMRDLLPPGHPARAMVPRWFACYLTAGLGAFVVFVTACCSRARSPWPASCRSRWRPPSPPAPRSGSSTPSSPTMSKRSRG